MNQKGFLHHILFQLPFFSPTAHVISAKLLLFGYYITHNSWYVFWAECGGWRLAFRNTPLWMTAHPPTLPPPLGCDTEKKRPQPPILGALSIWKKHHWHTYNPLHGFCRIFILQKNISARSEEHKRPCEIPFIAVSSDTLQRWQTLPPAPHERFRRKFLKMCQRHGLHLLKIKSPSFLFF